MTSPESFRVDPTLLRHTMGGFATGVAIITTEVDGEAHGMTVNSLTSLSLDPPLLLVCFTKEARTAMAVHERGAFVVNVLSKRQQALSDRFAKAGEDHFGGLQIETNEIGLPIVPGSIGHLVCRVDTTHPGGDHDIVIGEVIHCEPAEGSPLIFHRGRYHELSGRSREAHVYWYW